MYDDCYNVAMIVKGNDQEADKEEHLNQFILDLRPIVEELVAILAEHPGQPHTSYHRLSRPGLHVQNYWSTTEISSVELCAPGVPLLEVSISGIITLSTYVKTSGGQSQRMLHVSSDGRVLLHSADVIAGFSVDFSHAGEVLSKAIHCLRGASPLCGSCTWPEALRQSLDQETEKSFRLEKWTDWLTTWGTPEMLGAMSMASSLFDQEKNFNDWKALVLVGWTSLEQSGTQVPLSIAPSLFE